MKKNRIVLYTSAVAITAGLAAVAALAVITFMPYRGWKSTVVQSEKLTIRYPKDWKLEGSMDITTGIPEVRYRLSKIDGDINVDIEVLCGNGAFPKANTAAYDTLKVFGREYYLDLMNYNEPADPSYTYVDGLYTKGTVTGAVLSASKDDYRMMPASKNVRYQGKACPLHVQIVRLANHNISEVSVNTMRSKSDYKTAQKIISSMHY